MKICPTCKFPLALINCQVWRCYNCGYEEPRFPEQPKPEAEKSVVTWDWDIEKWQPFIPEGLNDDDA